MATEKLIARWDKRQRDYIAVYPTKRDGNLILHALFDKKHGPDGYFTRPSLAEQLEARGYDLTTLRFECSRKQDAPEQ